MKTKARISQHNKLGRNYFVSVKLWEQAKMH